MSASEPMFPNLAGEAAAVHAVAEALRQAVNGSDVDGIVDCWAPDGIMLPPNHAPVYGRSAIRDYFSRVFASRRLTFTFTDATVGVFGDLAIERLHYTANVAAVDGPMTEDVGKGIHICTRRADGTWQLAQDIWNSDRSPSASSGK
jgi:uncharacterized protein (TIGR02246 family)